MAQVPEFKYAPMFQLGKDDTEYYLLTSEGVSVSEFEGHKILKVTPEALTRMSNQAFRDVSFMLRRSHNEQVAKILRDPEASENDKYVALTFLRNAEVACKGKFAGGGGDGQRCQRLECLQWLPYHSRGVRMGRQIGR